LQASRLEAHRVEPATGTGETMATEPPEQLLGAVRRHDPSECDSYQEKTGLHLFLLLPSIPSGLRYFSLVTCGRKQLFPDTMTVYGE